MSGCAARLQPLVAARLAADRARLADCLARIRALREEAEALREAVRAARAGADAPEMLALSRWQAAAGRRAHAALEAARALEPERAALARRLARSLGRERAVADLAAAEHSARQRAVERRAEDAVPSGMAVSGPALPVAAGWRAGAGRHAVSAWPGGGGSDRQSDREAAQSPRSLSSGVSSVGTE